MHRIFIVEYAITYGQTYHGQNVWWSAAKSFCDCLGGMVVLDTQEKHDHLMTKIGSL